MEAGGTPATPTKPLQRRSFVGFVPRTIIIGAHSAPYVFSSGRSPDGMHWNPGEPFDRLRTSFGHAHQTPDFAALHPGYVTGITVSTTALRFCRVRYTHHYHWC